MPQDTANLIDVLLLIFGVVIVSDRGLAAAPFELLDERIK